MTRGSTGWHVEGCAGACLACLIEADVLRAYGAQGLGFLRERVTTAGIEQRLLACLREYRRLSNQAVVDSREAEAVHRESDLLLSLDPAGDDPAQRFDSPAFTEHRALVERLLHRRS